MVDTTDLTTPAPNGERPLPEYVRVVGAPRFSANQLRQIQATTGMSLEQIMGDGAAVMQAYAYTRLRLDGYDLSWEAAGDVLLEFAELASDPTSTDIATASPRSVGSGE